MTGTNTKVRSIFLTVLMVLSVFAGTVAFAGSAAAAGSGNLTLSDDTAGEDGVTYTQSQTTTTSQDMQFVEVDFRVNNNGSAPDLSGVNTNDITVIIDGTEYQDSYSISEKSGDLVRFKLQNSVNVNNGDNVTVSIGDVVNANNFSASYTYVTRLQTTTEGQTFDSRTDSYTLTAPPQDGGQEGDQDPPYEIGDGDDSFATGSLRWTGQMLFFQSPGNGSDTYELYPVKTVGGQDVRGDNPKQIVLSSNGSTLINTRGLQGEYVIVDDNGDRVITNSDGVQVGTNSAQSIPDSESVLINQQNLDASFDEDTITQGDNVTLDVVSNRGTYDIEVTSPDASDDEVAEVFGGEDNIINISGDGAYTFQTTEDAPTGNITFNFDVVDTTASDSDFLTIDKLGEKRASFPQSVFQEERGDNVTFTVETQRGGSAVLHVGDEDVNYNATMTVNDNDGDGEVTIEWSTYLAGQVKGQETRAYRAISGDDDDDDTLTSVKLETKEIQGRLAAADYDLEIFSQSDSGLTSEDVAVITLTERSTDDATQFVAPRNADTSNATLTRNASTAAEAVAKGDQAVTQFTVSGIYGYAASEADLANGSDDGVTVTIEQSEADTNVAPKEIEYRSDENAGDTVQFNFDEDSNQFYVVIDTRNARATQGTQSNIPLKAGETYNVTFEIDGDVNEYVAEGETETVTAQFTVEEPTAEFDTAADGNVTVEAAADQQITGTTNLAPGTELTVRARAEGSSPFLKSNTTTVQDDGTFAATFDFTNVSNGQQFTVSIPNKGFEDNAETPGIVAPAPSATVTINNQTSDGTTAVVASASLSDGGFITIHDGTLLDGATFDSVRGTSDYLEAGNHTDVEVTLDEPYSETGTAIAMPHLDTNDNQAYDFVTSEGAEDGPYTDDAGNITLDSATLTVSTPTPTPSPTATPEPASPTPSPSPTEPSTPTPSPTPTQGQPGFGFAVAIVALAGAALLALRRN